MKTLWTKMTVVAATILAGGSASAQADIAGTGSFMFGTVIPWAQGMGLGFAIIGFIRVGFMYSQGDPHAPTSLKNTAIGASLVVVAVTVAEFIKNTLGGNF